jgi:hypothetical protein
MQNYIQQGSEGVRVFSFLGGIMLCIFGLHFVVTNIFGLVTNTLYWIVNGYITAFSILVMVLEADPKWVEQNDKLESTQKQINEYMMVLTTLWGRGAFYLFLGVSALNVSDSFTIGSFVALYMCLMGILHIIMHFGYKPLECLDPIMENIKRLASQYSGSQGDYIRIS